MRLFTAIELPRDVRNHLKDVKAQLISHAIGIDAAVSWVQDENLHVTLKFVGEIADADVPRLTDALSHVDVPTMRLAVCGMLLFPQRGPARVIGAALSGDVNALGDLFQHVEDACASAGVPREGRAYTPHVTFGRARRTPGSGRAALRNIRNAALSQTTFPGPAFGVREFVLMQSVLGRGGATYMTIARFGK
jgi:2'-5' RNA ligase